MCVLNWGLDVLRISASVSCLNNPIIIYCKYSAKFSIVTKPSEILKKDIMPGIFTTYAIYACPRRKPQISNDNYAKPAYAVYW